METPIFSEVQATSEGNIFKEREAKALKVMHDLKDRFPKETISVPGEFGFVITKAPFILENQIVAQSGNGRPIEGTKIVHLLATPQGLRKLTTIEYTSVAQAGSYDFSEQALQDIFKAEDRHNIPMAYKCLEGTGEEELSLTTSGDVDLRLGNSSNPFMSLERVNAEEAYQLTNHLKEVSRQEVFTPLSELSAKEDLETLNSLDL